MPIMRKMNLINVHFWTYLPYGARKNTTQLAKYPRVLCVKPSDKVYIFGGARGIYGGAYYRREICSWKSTGLIIGVFVSDFSV